MLTLISCALIILLLGIYLQCKSKQTRIKQWQKSLNITEHAEFFEKLYQNMNGFALSQQARQEHDAFDYIYGEIEFSSFLALLSLTKPNHNTVFYDLGCGTGKAVLACAMVYPVRKSIGVEIFPQIYLGACEQQQRLAKIKKYENEAKKIRFILNDFLKINLHEATHIFINATALFNPTWVKLCAHLDKLSNVETIITTSKPLHCKNFKVLLQTQVEMSWGIVSAYIHVQKTNAC